MRRPIIFVLLAGFAALVAAMVVYSALKKRETEVQQAKLQSVNIVVAAHELGIGTKLDPSSVKTVRWSRDALPPGAFTDPSAVMNKYTKVSFVENQPIVADWLFSGTQNAGVLPLLIPPGMRAISVPVDEVSDIAGFVLPHAYVDVLVTAPGSSGKPLTKIVLQNVEVLAIAQEIEQINNKPQVVHVVTMLVTPDQAERLALASAQGGLRLALRNYDDKKIIATNGVTVAQLLGAAPSAAPTEPVQHVVYAAPRARPKPKPVSVEVMRNGTSTESISFVKSGSGRDASMRAAPSEPAAPAKEATPPGGDSSKAGGADNFASARAAMTLGSSTSASFPASGSATADSLAHGLNAAAAAEPARPAVAASTPSEETAGSTYGGPMSKTIDVP